MRTELHGDRIEFTDVEPKFFRAAADFRRWLERNSNSETELWVGYFKSGSGTASVTWPESVAEVAARDFEQGVGDRERASDEAPVLRTEMEFIVNPRSGDGYADAVEIR